MTAVIFAILAVVAILAIRKPPILVGVSVSIYSFEQWAQVNSAWFVVNDTFLNLYMGVLVLAACAAVMVKGRSLFNPFPRGLIVFWSLYAFSFASIIWSINTQQSFALVETFIPYIVATVLLTPLLISDEEDVKTAIMSILYLGSIVTIMLLLGTRVHDWGRTIVLESGPQLTNRRGDTTDRLSPLTVAELAGEVMMVAFLLRVRGVNKIWSMLRWVVLIVCLFQIFRSGSRGQLFAAVGVLVMFFGSSRSKSKGGQLFRGAIAMALLGGAAVIVYFSYESIVSARWNLDYMVEEYSQSRLATSGLLMKYWITSSPFAWFFGIGTAGSFDERVIGFYPHIIPIEILGETGFIGFAIYATTLYLAVKAWLNMMSIHADNPEKRGMVSALGAMYAFTFLLSLKQGNFLGSVNFGLFSIMLYQFEAISVRNQAKERKKKAFWMWQQMAARSAVPQPQVQHQASVNP